MSRTMSLPQAPLPDVRVMNALSMVLGAAVVLMALAIAIAWLMRQPLFNLSAIRVLGDVSHNNTVNLRANVMPRLAGNFFTIDLARTRAVFESVPWVRKAVVQRQFPDRLKVLLQEHQAVAYWGAEGDSRLVNSFGEVFEANQGEVESQDLPQLSGPQGEAAAVLQAYQTLAPLFQQLDATLQRLDQTGQGGWRARLESGAVIELGGGSLEEITARVRRFVATLTQASSAYGGESGRGIESADLRYGNGYALRLRGVTTVSPGDKEDKKGKR
jgi:cell division protein FtsQ